MQNKLIGLKTVIRTKDLAASRRFYKHLLKLTVLKEYNDGGGAKGVIFLLSPKGSNAMLEISAIDKTMITIKKHLAMLLNPSGARL